MKTIALVTNSYFDGVRLHNSGPYTIVVDGGTITAIEPSNITALMDNAEIVDVPFVMPGMVEGHCHLFLNGAELDAEIRKQYLSAPFNDMMAMARTAVASHVAAGITLIRDAGDLYGVNRTIKAELAALATSGQAVAVVRSPGKAIRKKGRYGGFMAAEVTDSASIVQAIADLPPSAQDLKIVLTGIIDFEKGEVKGAPQFTLDECKLMVQLARERGLRTYAHCSGLEGLYLAVESGIDSIEHGFFMNREILQKMADKGIAWVPTISPVYFQYARPELAGWNASTVLALRRILDNHFEMLAVASDCGVPIVMGSDAGSYGVPHGTGLIDELFYLQRTPLTTAQILASATSVPRRLWGCASANIAVGNSADMALLSISPFDDFNGLRQVQGVVLNGTVTGKLEMHDRVCAIDGVVQYFDCC